MKKKRYWQVQLWMAEGRQIIPWHPLWKEPEGAEWLFKSKQEALETAKEEALACYFFSIEEVWR